MKKIALMLIMVTLGCAVSAQTLNVQSASEAMRRGYLDKAKKLIDGACQHEQTMNDAKTWYYAGLIYSQIGGEADKAKSKYKDLDPEWLTKAKNAAFRCKELDSDKEFADGNNNVFGFVGNAYYQKAVEAFQSQDWTASMGYCDESIKIFNECGKKNFAADSYLLAGKAAMNAQDNELILKYFKPLVRTRTKEKIVYNTLFNIYKVSADTNEAMKLAQNYTKSCPDDFNANMMMAEAYMLKGNMEQGNAEIQKALQKTVDNPELHAQMLAVAGATLESVGDFTNAELNYQESLKTLPSQFVANFGLGKMFYNRAVDKLDAANNVPLDDETGLSDKLVEESKDFFRQSIPYMSAAIAYLESLDEQTQAQHRKDMFNCLNALKTVYARLEMYDELKPINAKIDALQKAAQ